MASAFGHSIAAIGLSRFSTRYAVTKKLYFAGIISAFIPDADVMAFRLGIPYEAMMGHRGFSHSILFALLWAAFLSVFFFRAQFQRSFWVIFTCTLSHGILDAMTNGGLGVGFLIPFNENRYFLPFRPIQVSPVSIFEFIRKPFVILRTEFYWIGIPSLILFLVGVLREKWGHKTKPTWQNQ